MVLGGSGSAALAAFSGSGIGFTGVALASGLMVLTYIVVQVIGAIAAGAVLHAIASGKWRTGFVSL